HRVKTQPAEIRNFHLQTNLFFLCGVQQTEHKTKQKREFMIIIYGHFPLQSLQYRSLESRTDRQNDGTNTQQLKWRLMWALLPQSLHQPNKPLVPVVTGPQRKKNTTCIFSLLFIM
uniref:Uncharacterized protein n=1 Tax=Oryzias latipes TaxID=8090 RepID=A0A3P9L8J7_ORYLA